ncbi:hypothetical protein GGTG_04321 [Gaeumannomyces tritici R3-111a-1]|uniref:Uncharacterized protein n=1 Tax=Gaeumannomyces tritici (strain R3-111a-1) TaxID=644352 RepID=J3NSS2_GAET3|nr:hypothetical protein GGTG_04321 [Gaeumannomyces tritici R3-111a-1]EJT79235.1 hypothetical protein GGTG_04321 [Gaeumannomyces tritici R3-111a-1]
MSGKLYSPYNRRKPSNTLVIVWCSAFFTLLILTWWISTRHSETARRYADKFAEPPRHDD